MQAHGGFRGVNVFGTLLLTRQYEYLLQIYQTFLARHQGLWKGGLNHKPRSQEIVVSITSYPARIRTLAAVLVPLFRQTMQPDRVILYLATSQFPNLNSDLPGDLLALCKKGLEIHWCDEDLRSHKKFFYVMQEYPDACVITIDDDIFYNRDLVENLWNTHLQDLQAVVANRIRRITFDTQGRLVAYRNWKLLSSAQIASNVEGNSLLATSGGGTLFPPHCMHDDLFRKDLFLKLCPYADDLWLKIMQVLNHTRIVPVPSLPRTTFMLVSNAKGGLAEYNYFDGNDRQLQALLNYYDQKYGKQDFLLRKMRGSSCPDE